MLPRVRPDNLAAAADANFCPYRGQRSIGTDSLSAEIADLDPDESAATTTAVRQSMTLERAGAALTEIYEEAINSGCEVTPSDESKALANYLLRLAERVGGVDLHQRELVEQKHRADARSAKWQDKASAQAAQLRWIECEMNGRGNWWRRRLWRKMRRAWEAAEASDSQAPRDERRQD